MSDIDEVSAAAAAYQAVLNERKNQIKQMLADGMNQSEISRKLNLSRQRVSQICLAMGQQK